jgi:hypothetical protein
VECFVIVRPVPGGVQLITQPEHARLARKIMEHHVPLAAQARRGVILETIAQHDNGWAEEDAAPAVNPETGRIYDFVTAPLDVRHRVWPRAVRRLEANPWAAALVAQHALTIYDRFRCQAEWSAFFGEMDEARQRLVRASGLAPNDLAADYVFLRLGDLISLAFCTGWTDEQRLDQWTVSASGGRVVVKSREAHPGEVSDIVPAVWVGAAIPIELKVREIRKETFRSDAELREALSHASTTTLRGGVVS